jgi:hypothetical protein
LVNLHAYFDALKQSFRNNDIFQFRKLIRKLKPGFTCVGLTDLIEKFQKLEINCIEGKYLVMNEIEIQNLLSRIRSSTECIEAITHRLQK